MIDFVPSQVNLDAIFVSTFDHVEAENTAAVIVKVLALNGDVWRSATCEELAAGFGQLTKDDGPWRRRFNNPFMRIDMHDLVDRGFAIWDGAKAIRFTDKGAGAHGEVGFKGDHMSLFGGVFDPQKDAQALSQFIAPIVQQSVASAIAALKEAEATALFAVKDDEQTALDRVEYILQNYQIVTNFQKKSDVGQNK